MTAPRYARLTLYTILTILLIAGDRFPARAQTQAPVPVKPAAATCQRAALRVVVDVGHTLDVPGAFSARGIPEYAFNLQLGQDVDRALVNDGFGKTELLITAIAPWKGLVERAARANGMRADLFISIHHDSVPDNLLQNWEYEGNALKYDDDYPGYALFISNDNADPAGSLMFGSLLGNELSARGLHYTPHYTLALMGNRRRQLVDAQAGVYRYDQLIVLRETRMPAVLLEAGSIVNRQEELELGTPERRALTSAAIVGAVEKFCEARAHAAAAKTATRSTRGNFVAPPR
jgi:N-acetylmuramoyl-L-alanine amidase